MPIPLEPDGYYHIYNHANGSDDLFTSDDNYHYFLSKYAHYIRSVADTFCYCLMPNHFHFLIRIKDEKEVLNFINAKQERHPSKSSKTLGGVVEVRVPTHLSNQFGHFFNSYTQAYNKQQMRKGSLFMPNFKRKHINNEKYLRKLVHYIHYNPIEHGFCEKIEDWKFSSYNSLLSDNPTQLKRKEVIEWFDDKENFIYCHQHPPELTGIHLFKTKHFLSKRPPRF